MYKNKGLNVRDVADYVQVLHERMNASRQRVELAGKPCCGLVALKLSYCLRLCSQSRTSGHLVVPITSRDSY